jgi:hypothetical protein
MVKHRTDNTFYCRLWRCLQMRRRLEKTEGVFAGIHRECFRAETTQMPADRLPQ